MESRNAFFFDFAEYSSFNSLGEQEIYIFKWISTLNSFLKKAVKDDIVPYKTSLLGTVFQIILSSEGLQNILLVSENKFSWLESKGFNQNESFQIKPNRRIRVLCAKVLVRAVITCISTLFETLGGIGGFRLLSFLSEFTNIFIKIAKFVKEPVIVRTEAIKAIGSIIKGGGKVASDQILLEIFKTFKILILNDYPLISIPSMKVMEYLINHTQYFKSPENVVQLDVYLQNSLIKIIPAKIASFRKSLSNLISSIILINVPLDDPSQWDLQKEVTSQLSADKPTSSFFSPRGLNSEPVKVESTPHSRKMSSSLEIKGKSSFESLGAKNDPNFAPISEKANSYQIAFPSHPLKENKSSGPFAIKHSFDASRTKASDDFEFSRKSDVLENMSAQYTSAHSSDPIKPGETLSFALKKLSFFFTKPTCSREERAAISEIYYAVFSKMGQEYIEAHYPVIVFHIMVDLLGSCQVKFSSPKNTVVTIGSLDPDSLSALKKNKSSALDLALQSTTLGVRNIANWLLRIPLSQKALTRKFKPVALKYLYNFWISGFYNYFSKESSLESAEDFGDKNIAAFSRFRMLDSWEGINLSNYEGIERAFRQSGKFGLLVILQECASLINELGSESSGLRLFLSSIAEPKNDISSSEDLFNNLTLAQSTHLDSLTMPDISDFSNESIIGLVSSNSESVRLSAIFCVSQYLNHSPRLIAPAINFIFTKMCERLQLVSKLSDGIAFLNEDQVLDFLESHKLTSKVILSSSIEADTYTLISQALNKLIKSMNRCIGLAQGLASVISNSLPSNPLFAPLNKLDNIYEAALIILQNVYETSSSGIISVESVTISSDKTQSNGYDKSSTSAVDVDSQISFKMFSSDPLELSRLVGIQPSDIWHLSTSGASSNPKNKDKIFDSVVSSQKSDHFAEQKDTVLKTMIMHTTKLALSNTRLNVGWTLLSSYLSLIPNIYGPVWLSNNIQSDWLPIWKKSLLFSNKNNKNSKYLNEPEEFENFGNFSGYVSNLRIDLSNSVPFLCMPWSDRSHLLQSKWLSVQHIAQLLNLVSSFYMNGTLANLLEYVPKTVFQDIEMCLKSGFSVTSQFINLPAPPKHALDFGAICGESYILVDDSLLSDCQRKLNTIFAGSAKLSNVYRHNMFSWAYFYSLGYTINDLCSPLECLPNSQPFSYTYTEIYKSIFSSLSSLEIIGCNLKLSQDPLISSFAINILAGPNNLMEVIREKVKTSSNNSLSRALKVKSNPELYPNLQSLDATLKELSDKNTYSAGFERGPWGYEVEIGQSSIFRKVTTVQCTLNYSQLPSNNMSSMVKILGLKNDFTSCDLTSLENKGFGICCPDPPKYRPFIPLNSNTTPSHHPYTSLIDSCVIFFASAFKSKTIQSQSKLLQDFLDSMQALPYNSHKQVAIMSNFLSFMYMTLQFIAERLEGNEQLDILDKPPPRNEDAAYERLLPLSVSTFIADVALSALIVPSSPHRLLASEILGLTTLCTDRAPEYMTYLIDRLTQLAIRSRDRFERAGTALALGSIFAYAGSITGSVHLQKLFAMLHSLSSDQDPLVHSWALRALSEVVNSAGFMYSKYGSDTVRMVAKLYISDSHSYPFIGEHMPQIIHRKLPLYSNHNKIQLSSRVGNLEYVASEKYQKNGGPEFQTDREKEAQKSARVESALPTIAYKEYAAIYHQDSLTHKYEPYISGARAINSGTSTFSMGTTSVWLKTCCECDLDSFDSRSAISKLLSSLIIALGPNIQSDSELNALVLVLIKEFISISQEIGINVSPIKANPGSLQFETTSTSSLYNDTLILSMVFSSRYLESSTMLSSLFQFSEQGTLRQNNAEMSFDVLPASLWTEGSYSDSVNNADSTSALLSESIYLLQQQLIFLPISRGLKYSPKLYSELYLDSVINNNLRPILRSTAFSDCLNDSYVENGIRDLQISAVNALDSVVRLYASNILQSIPILHDTDLIAKDTSSLKPEDGVQAWLLSLYSEASRIYPLLGWSWADVLYESLILHSISQDSGTSDESSALLSKNIETLANSIVDYVLNSEISDISKLNQAINYLYGLSDDICLSIPNPSSINITQTNDYTDFQVDNPTFKRLEIIVFVQLLTSIVLDKHNVFSPRFARKNINSAQWVSERTDNFRAADQTWLSLIDNKFSFPKDLQSKQSKLKPVNSSHLVEPSSHSFSEVESNHKVLNFSTQNLAIKLILKILNGVFDKIGHADNSISNVISKAWRLNIFAHLTSDLISTAYSAIKIIHENNDQSDFYGVELMNVIIKEFFNVPDLAVLKKKSADISVITYDRMEIVPALTIYEAQIKSCIVPIVSLLEDKHAINLILSNDIVGDDIPSIDSFIKRPLEYIIEGISLALNCLIFGIFRDSRFLKRTLSALSVLIQAPFHQYRNKIQTQVLTRLCLDSAPLWEKIIHFILQVNENTFGHSEDELLEHVYVSMSLFVDQHLELLIKVLVGGILDWSVINLFISRFHKKLQFVGSDLYYKKSKGKKPLTNYTVNQIIPYPLELFRIPFHTEYAAYGLYDLYSRNLETSIVTLSSLLLLKPSKELKQDSDKRSTFSALGKCTTSALMDYLRSGDVSNLFFGSIKDAVQDKLRENFSINKILNSCQTCFVSESDDQESIHTVPPSKRLVHFLFTILYICDFKSTLISPPNYQKNQYLFKISMPDNYLETNRTFELAKSNAVVHAAEPSGSNVSELSLLKNATVLSKSLYILSKTIEHCDGLFLEFMNNSNDCSSRSHRHSTFLVFYLVWNSVFESLSSLGDSFNTDSSDSVSTKHILIENTRSLDLLLEAIKVSHKILAINSKVFESTTVLNESGEQPRKSFKETIIDVYKHNSNTANEKDFCSLDEFYRLFNIEGVVASLVNIVGSSLLYLESKPINPVIGTKISDIYTSSFKMLLDINLFLSRQSSEYGSEFYLEINHKLFLFLKNSLFGDNFDIRNLLGISFQDIDFSSANSTNNFKILSNGNEEIVQKLLLLYEQFLTNLYYYLKSTTTTSSTDSSINTGTTMLSDNSFEKRYVAVTTQIYSSLLNKTLKDFDYDSQESKMLAGRVFLLISQLYKSNNFSSLIDKRVSADSHLDMFSVVLLRTISQILDRLQKVDLTSVESLDLIYIESLNNMLKLEFNGDTVTSASDQHRIYSDKILFGAFKCLALAINQIESSELEKVQLYEVYNIFDFISRLQELVSNTMLLGFASQDSKNSLILSLVVLYLTKLNKSENPNNSSHNAGSDVFDKSSTRELINTLISKRILALALSCESEFRFAAQTIIKFSSYDTDSDNQNNKYLNSGNTLKALLESVLLKANDLKD
ncbi:hypothetical protein BB560_005045 [Smittium megazygosporum]|uniref:Uncharacterized protein n=1 Tax=Smittium megazygosporum TaxID=133381 RepID=A0A2T9Z7J4_9FUNG|nr:hypothetical protein BB560_005045 [Smittium megazygosporum]